MSTFCVQMDLKLPTERQCRPRNGANIEHPTLQHRLFPGRRGVSRCLYFVIAMIYDTHLSAAIMFGSYITILDHHWQIRHGCLLLPYSVFDVRYLRWNVTTKSLSTNRNFPQMSQKDRRLFQCGVRDVDEKSHSL